HAIHAYLVTHIVEEVDHPRSRDVYRARADVAAVFAINIGDVRVLLMVCGYGFFAELRVAAAPGLRGLSIGGESTERHCHVDDCYKYTGVSGAHREASV